MKPVFKYILILSITFITVVNVMAQDSPGDRFRKGAAAYTAGNYQDAVGVWTNLYKTGYRSARLDYNIGNAYFKLNNIPQAILFYERAKLLNPADEDIDYNLQIARTLTVDRFQEIPELFFVKWYDFVSLILSTNMWARISIVSFVFCLLLLSLYIYSSGYRMKVLGFWFAVFFFVLSGASLTFSLRNKSLVYDSHKAIIAEPQVSGKSSPDSSGTDLFILHEGTKVSVEDEVGDWLEITLSDGNKGWVPSNSLDII
ncbi:MAG TPA: SH3 domain-containing protein [Bacteroidales bacterium]|nr:SH3 domain-containing protein [Bacteroidales bacterium]